jgi:hypothetical protein
MYVALLLFDIQEFLGVRGTKKIPRNTFLGNSRVPVLLTDEPFG